jgi:hypothetical protein
MRLRRVCAPLWDYCDGALWREADRALAALGLDDEASRKLLGVALIDL